MPLKLVKRGSIWHLHGTIAGQRIRQSTGLGNKGQADIYRARIEAQAIQRHALGRANTLTFAQAALTYLESGGAPRFVAPLLDHFGPDFLLHNINNDVLNRAADALHPGAAPATINRQVITPASAIYNMSADDDLVPHRRFRRRKVPRGRTRWLTPAEAARLLAQLDARARIQVEFLLGTGCRTGEAFSLERADLYLETRQAMVPFTKNGDLRMVRLPIRTARALAAYGVPDAGRVFRTDKGKPYVIRENGGGQMQAVFNRARDAAGLGPDVTPHVLRHTWATWHYAQNKDVQLLQDLGGWRKIDMALHYAKLAPADLGSLLIKYGWDFRSDTKSRQELSPDQHNNLTIMGN